MYKADKEIEKAKIKDRIYDLFDAIEEDDAGELRLILLKTPKHYNLLSSTNDIGYTVIMMSAHLGSIDCLTELIKHGSDINIKTHNHDETALSIAAQSGKGKSIQILLNQPNINIDSQDIWGNTPLIRAVRSGKTPCVTLLLSANADVSLTDQYRQTALMHAASGTHPAMVKHILDYDDNIEKKDENNNTALLLAFKNHNARTETIRTLFNVNANPYARDKKGKTLQSWALQHSRTDLFEMLTHYKRTWEKNKAIHRTKAVTEKLHRLKDRDRNTAKRVKTMNRPAIKRRPRP